MHPAIVNPNSRVWNTAGLHLLDYLKKFIKGYIKMGSTKVCIRHVGWLTFQIEKRIRGYNFTLPVVDAMQKENVRFPPDFIQGFRLGLYTFINYKTTQELNEVFQVMFDAGL